MLKLIDDNDSDLQRLNELERKKQAVSERVSKKENKAKILLGEFLIDMLEKKSVAGLNDYVASSFEKFLNSDDTKALAGVIKKIKVIAEKEVDSSSDSTDKTSDNGSKSVANDDKKATDNAIKVDEVKSDKSQNPAPLSGGKSI